MTVLRRNNVEVRGAGHRPMVFSHGFGCDKNMWRFVSPAFESEFEVILFDHVGAGGSDLSAYDDTRHSTLGGYADDLIEICQELNVTGGVFVGHSVSAMVGVLAARKAPHLFSDLVLVGPSP
ncbi:MAG: alpha/beta hydrolase fold protein, partial [Hyphomicrobiales bacterium]|nr:alpha/beta hydrolase fold protein [Hyphomicrobiales bacterium]